MNKKLVELINTMPSPRKDSRNGHFKNEYASLGSVTDTVRNHLKPHGFAVTQTFDGTTLVTSVWAGAESEDWPRPVLESRLDIDFASGSGPNYWQVVGQGITYLRRYALTAMFCLNAGDVDDDAELQTWFNEQQKNEAPSETNGIPANVQNNPTGTPSRVL